MFDQRQHLIGDADRQSIKLETARAWTIHSCEDWEMLRASNSVSRSNLIPEEFRTAYDWMAQQMSRRIGPPPEGVTYPIWTWYQYDGDDQQKPDISREGHLPTGTQAVLVELEVARESILLSDFELWHFVLNEWYLPISEKDQQRFESLLKDYGYDGAQLSSIGSPEIQQMIRHSWLRIFDLDLSDPYVSSPVSEKAIQGTVWTLDAAKVVSIEGFTSK